MYFTRNDKQCHFTFSVGDTTRAIYFDIGMSTFCLKQRKKLLCWMNERYIARSHAIISQMPESVVLESISTRQVMDYIKLPGPSSTVEVPNQNQN